MPNTPLDQWFSELFISGFGNSNLVWLGHLLLFLIIMICTTFLAGIVGFEREYRGHAAGFRTHILVGLASALIMYISVWGVSKLDYPGRDPFRLAAQVVSGIGFLGAGAIIQTGVSVKGLTTATTLWLVMAIGLACGSGNILIAVLTTAVCLVALIAFRRAEKMINKRNPIITIVVPSETAVLRSVLDMASRFGINVKNIDSQIARYREREVLRVRLYCAASSKNSFESFVDELKRHLQPLELHISNSLQ